MFDLDQELLQISNEIHTNGGKPLLVGGFVRDHFLGLNSKDIDVEVFNMESELLTTILRKFGKVSEVGQQFGVIKLTTKENDFDFSLPRRENKTGAGHTGFDAVPDPNMTVEEAASRRDFTINSMSWDIINGGLLDPFNGLDDLNKKVLRHVGPKFGEDPLRVLRAVQFAARFVFVLAPETASLAESMVASGCLDELPKERIWEEFKKLLLKAEKPSIGFELMESLGVSERMFPELHALVGVPQDPIWHCEGPVDIHTNMVVDQAAKLRTGDEEHDLILMLAALCHDFGKPATTEFIDERWRSRGHEAAGMLPTNRFLERLTNEVRLTNAVPMLVAHHLKPALFFQDRENIKDSAFRRLSTKVDMLMLAKVATADHLGRATPDALAGDTTPIDWFVDKVHSLGVEQEPKPILMGRHLIERGMKPGQDMGLVLNAAFQAQIEGCFSDLSGAIKWLDGRSR